MSRIDDTSLNSREEKARETSSATQKKKSLCLKLFVAAAGFIGIAGLCVATFFLFFHQPLEDKPEVDVNMENFPHQSEVQPQQQSVGTNFLIIGSDARSSQGTADGQEGGQRSDVIMLAQLSADGSHFTVLSIPRDTAVVIPGYENDKETKLNHAFSYGGVPLLVSTIEKNTGIKIDHAAVMDFQSFVGLTDVIGGVTLTSEAEGTKTYSGEEALTFVRERYGLPRGDFDRMRRQQEWMEAVINELLSRDILANPTEFKAVYDVLHPYMTFDDSFGIVDAFALAELLGAMDKSAIRFATVPTANSGLNEEGSWLTHFDPSHFEPMCEAFQKGEVWKYVEENAEAFDCLDSRPVA